MYLGWMHMYLGCVGWASIFSDPKHFLIYFPHPRQKSNQTFISSNHSTSPSVGDGMKGRGTGLMDESLQKILEGNPSCD